MTENKNLRTLLADARAVLSANCDNGQCCGIRGRIDAALAAPPGPERSPLYPGEGTWSVFSEKVVAERDEARAEVERLRGLFDTTRHQICRSLGASDSIGWASVLMEISQTRSNNNMLLRERDEARAEVERLKASYDAVCRERNKIQVRFSILSKRWISYRSVELLRQVEWVIDGRESTTSCLFCHQSYAQGHAADCDAFGRIGGVVPPDVVEYALCKMEDE
jgi:hypothetical protein